MLEKALNPFGDILKINMKENLKFTNSHAIVTFRSGDSPIIAKRKMKNHWIGAKKLKLYTKEDSRQ